MKILFSFLLFLPVFSFAQKDFQYFHDSIDSMTWETIQPLHMGFPVQTKIDTVFIDCLCVHNRYGLIIQKKKRERTLEKQKVTIPTNDFVYYYNHKFIPIETRWIDDVDDCYILIKAADSM